MEHDDGIRPDISTSALAKLKPVFKKDGSTTAGNSSQVRLAPTSDYTSALKRWLRVCVENVVTMHRVPYSLQGTLCDCPLVLWG